MAEIREHLTNDRGAYATAFVDFTVCHNLGKTVGQGEIDAPVSNRLNKRAY